MYMNFKYSILTVIICLFFFSPALAAEKWKVLVSNWEDLSASQDKTIGTMIQRSVSAQLIKKNQFQVTMDTNTKINTRTLREARAQGLKNKADVIIYGSFYVENERLFVVTEVYDILKNQLKLRKTYEGVITVDIFDTTDQMTADTIRKVEEVLPVLTVDSEVEIKKLRETIYETKDLQIKRLFYTRIGLMSALQTGPIGMKVESPSNAFYTTNDSSVAASHLEFGLTLRIWDFRLDGLFQLIGMPCYNYTYKTLSLNGLIPALMTQTLYYYLPWDGGRWAVGLGFININHFLEYRVNDVGSEYRTTGSFDPLVGVIYSPNRNIEFNLTVGIPIPTERNYTGYENDDPTNPYSGNEKRGYSFPPVGLSVIGFIMGDLGLESHISYSYWNYYYKETFDNNGGIRNFSSLTQQTFTFYLGMVYRVDFLGSK